MIGLQFRDQVTRLSQAVADEFDQLVTGAKGFLGVEHKDDGTHGEVTADSITVGTLTAENAHLTLVEVEGGSIIDASFAGVVDARPLRLRPHGLYTIAGTDSTLLGSGGSPLPEDYASVWHLSASNNRTVLGIWAAVVRPEEIGVGVPGQVIVLINDSAYFISFDGSVVTDEKRLYGCAPAIKIGPGGSIVFIYDAVRVGWRVVSHTRDYNADPAGVVQIQAMASIKPGWLQLGQAVSRADYPALFAEIGTTFGPGNGTTTFDLPPEGVFPLFSGGSPGFAVGATGGVWNSQVDIQFGSGQLVIDAMPPYAVFVGVIRT